MSAKDRFDMTEEDHRGCRSFVDHLRATQTPNQILLSLQHQNQALWPPEVQELYEWAKARTA